MHRTAGLPWERTTHTHTLTALSLGRTCPHVTDHNRPPQVYPIYGRVGPRIFRGPEGDELHFAGPNQMHGNCDFKIC